MNSKNMKCIFTVVFISVVLTCLLAACSEPSADKEDETFQEASGCTLPGALEIYPTVMVGNNKYEWRRGAAICEALPENCEYYGKVNHVEDADAPENNCDFVSVFTVSGQIYTVPGDYETVYLCLTSDWMEDWLNNTIVVFDLQ